MKAILIALAMTLPVTAVCAQGAQGTTKGSSYGTACSIKDGAAAGILYNYSADILNYTGRIMFYYYDDADNLVGSARTSDFGSVWAGDSATIAGDAAPESAVSCGMDASKAIKSGQTPVGPHHPGPHHPAGHDGNCRIEDGTAIGIIYNYSSEPLHYDGKFTFYYYDKEGNMLGSDWTRNFGTLWPNTSEKVTEDGIPDGAVACRMDAGQAVSTIPPSGR